MGNIKFISVLSSTFNIQHSAFIILLLLTAKGNAQSATENVLAEIKKNNKTIIATTQYWEAQKLQYKTGLTPYNPTVEYDYLKGTPAANGNQEEFNVNQSFDFPSAYFKKNQLSKQLSTQAEYKLTASRQDILLDAKKTCIQLIYHNKLQFRLVQQKQNTEKLFSAFKTKLEKGEGNILDVNKAQLQLIEIKKEFQDNFSEINQLNQKLTELNGGIAISLSDTVYPALPAIPPFEQLENDYESNDPLRKNLEQEKIIAQKQIEVSRALSLPKMELGYHYQGFTGQKFNGIHTGISIPLWENKNTVKQKKAQLLFAELELQAHINEHYYHIKHIYEKYSNLHAALHEYQDNLLSLNNNSLLDKALSSGHISTIEYFMEINYYYHAFNNYLETEKEFHETVADLYKYQL
ncbi:MAG TPA: TolC family protein [Bacteroidia bacterium]|nr:TolC family protein [Bacteroidia bacterium]